MFSLLTGTIRLLERELGKTAVLVPDQERLSLGLHFQDSLVDLERSVNRVGFRVSAESDRALESLDAVSTNLNVRFSVGVI